MKKPVYYSCLKSSVHLSSENNIYEPWIENYHGNNIMRGWKRVEVDTYYPVREYYIINGRDVSVYTMEDATRVFIIDNDPNVTFTSGEDSTVGIGTVLRFGDRAIRISTFREGSEEFSSARYSREWEIACMMDLFFDHNSLAVGDTVKEKMSDDGERKRIEDIMVRYRECYGDEAEVIFVRYGLNKA
jgi:hypothetical protein